MKRIYTDLDSLFDTRVVMLAVLTNNGELDIGVTPGDYTRRTRDNFGVMSSGIFNMYYSRRKKTVLNYAPPTYLFDFLKDYLLDSIHIDPEKNKDLELLINTHPYDLTVDETRIFLLIINKLLPGVDIKFINQNLLDISIDWVSNLDLFICYDTIKWLNSGLAKYELYSTKLLQTMIMAPYILTGVIESKQLDKDVFRTTRAYFNTLCKFEYVDAATFCGKEEYFQRGVHEV